MKFKNYVISILLTAIFWALIPEKFYYENLSLMIINQFFNPLIIFPLLFTVLYSKSIWGSMGYGFVNNFVVTLFFNFLLFAFQEDALLRMAGKMLGDVSPYVVLLIAPVVYGVMGLLAAGIGRGIKKFVTAKPELQAG